MSAADHGLGMEMGFALLFRLLQLEVNLVATANSREAGECSLPVKTLMTDSQPLSQELTVTNLTASPSPHTLLGVVDHTISIRQKLRSDLSTG